MGRDPEGAADGDEPEPIDPKVASRAITRHIQRKRATEIRPQDSEVQEPEARTVTPPTPSPPPPPPPAASDEAALEAIPIRSADLVRIMEGSPDSMLDEWIQIHVGEEARVAETVSRTEMEFLLLRKSLLD